MTMAYSNLTTDAISAYCFGEGFNLLSQPGWGSSFRKPNLAVLSFWFIFRFSLFLRVWLTSECVGML